MRTPRQNSNLLTAFLLPTLIGALFLPQSILAQPICESEWGPLGGGVDSPVSSLTVFDDGIGPALYAGGVFQTAGGVAVNNIAKWDGSSWSPLGSGVSNSVADLTVFDDGSGPALYAGGWFTTAGDLTVNYIAKWDGSGWEALGSGMDSLVRALTTLDGGSGPALYAAGMFRTAGGVPANYIARWHGGSWSPLGSGMSGGGDIVVITLTVFDDGGGPALYAGGHFTTAGGVPANHIAKWNGSNWSPLGNGMSQPGAGAWVSALSVFDDGRGPALYAGGGFTRAGGIEANCMARWRGSDLDGDSDIDLQDLAILLSNFGTLSGASRSDGDFNGDGAVRLDDLSDLLAAFGTDCRP